MVNIGFAGVFMRYIHSDFFRGKVKKKFAYLQTLLDFAQKADI